MSATTAGAQRTSPLDRALSILTAPTIGSLIVLLGFMLIFSFATDTFFAAGNLSLVVQQSVIIGTLAIGQTLVILTTLSIRRSRHCCSPSCCVGWWA
jgi:fructose transport system permease protein